MFAWTVFNYVDFFFQWMYSISLIYFLMFCKSYWKSSHVLTLKISKIETGSREFLVYWKCWWYLLCSLDFQDVIRLASNTLIHVSIYSKRLMFLCTYDYSFLFLYYEFLVFFFNFMFFYKMYSNFTNANIVYSTLRAIVCITPRNFSENIWGATEQQNLNYV